MREAIATKMTVLQDNQALLPQMLFANSKSAQSLLSFANQAGDLCFSHHPCCLLRLVDR